ncbi:MAG: VOC family protein [Saprospiraceae bacterium]
MRARLDTVNLFSHEPAQLRDFYHTVFNFEDVEFKSEPPESYVLDARGCQLCLKHWPTTRRHIELQPIELCIEVENLLQTMLRIKDHGGTILMDEPIGFDGVAFYATDPDGHQLLVEYVFTESSGYYF